KKIAPGLKTAAFQDWPQKLISSPRIRRTLKDDELTAAQTSGDRLAGIGDVRKVGFAVLRQRRRHADNDGICLTKPGRIRGRIKPAALDQVGDALGWNVPDVALAGFQLFYLFGIDIKANHAKSARGESVGQRQANVAQTDDADPGRPLFQAVHQGVVKTI